MDVDARTLGEIVGQEEQDLPAIKRRLDQGASPNDAAEFRNGVAPLYLAILRDHVEVVDALADAGAKLGWKDPDHGSTALHAAAIWGQAGAVRSLAARGVGRRWTRATSPIGRRCTGLPAAVTPPRCRSCWRPGRTPRSKTRTA